MKMIRQDHKAEKIDPEVRCQRTQLILDPGLAVGIVLFRDRIRHPAESKDESRDS